MTKKDTTSTAFELAIIPTEELVQKGKSDSLACLEWVVSELIKKDASTLYEEKTPSVCIYGDYYLPLDSSGNYE